MPIKSALEIAMERTKDLKVDSKALAANEARLEGKKLAGEYLADPAEVDFPNAWQPFQKTNATMPGREPSKFLLPACNYRLRLVPIPTPRLNRLPWGSKP
jgi:hypothetical protein